MSALGQKQTCAAQKIMSALPPKADMCGATRDVRFVPIADSCTAANIISIQSTRRGFNFLGHGESLPTRSLLSRRGIAEETVHDTGLRGIQRNPILGGILER